MRLSSTAVAVLVLACGAVSIPGAAAIPPRITESQKVAIIQSLISEVGIARHALPVDKNGAELSDDGTLINAGDVQDSVQRSGAAARPGDRVAITSITFKSDRIVFDLNGGPHTTHWYQHIQIGMGGNMPATQGPNQTAARGSVVTLRFQGDVPSLTPDGIRHDLSPLIDWSPPAEAEEMVKALPPAVKTAIADHKVLVGMSEDMVVAALGRTQNKTRETDPATGAEVADWIYGAPPAATTMVEFRGARVSRVTIYETDGKEVVEDTIDPALAPLIQQQDQHAAAAAQQADQPPPSLRRPGDAAPTVSSSPAPSQQPNQTQSMPGDSNQPGSFPGQTTPGQSLPGQQGPPGNGMPPIGPPTQPPVCCQLPGIGV